MMNLFQVLGAIYTRKDCNWVKDLEQKDAQPFLVLKFLSMNDRIAEHVKYLNKYVFYLDWREFLILAWATVPKYEKAPFVKYMKKEVEETPYEELVEAIRAALKLSENDLNSSLKYILAEIEQDKAGWFARLGMPDSVWKKYGVDYSEASAGETQKGKVGLENWF